jgi:sugar-specific transcriptional regulator TrmB/DNA-binding CsgD family transcriptional regulator
MARSRQPDQPDQPDPVGQGGRAVELEVLGLPEPADAVYRLLVGAETLSGAQIASAQGTSVEDVRVALRVLEDRGLVSHRLDAEDHYVATRPSVGLGAMLAERQNQIRMAEVVVRRLEETFGESRTERSPADLVDVVLGADAIRSRFEQIQESARDEVLALVQAPVSVVGSAENTAEDAAVDRGVKYRAVLERSMLQEEPRLYDEIVRIQERGEHIRLTAAVPLKLFVVDHSIALVPLGPATSPVPGALLVHPSGLLDALVALFETVWQDAVDIVPGPEGLAEESPHESVTPLDARILTLLLAGLTDQAVAGALGTSVRTVQRRIRFLMTAAGVETRMQLGWAASRLGWPVTGPGVAPDVAPATTPAAPL